VSQSIIDKQPIHLITLTKTPRKDFGRDFERHWHSSFGNQVCDKLGTTLEDCARHQVVHFSIG
jgi:hypothetical protein